MAHTSDTGTQPEQTRHHAIGVDFDGVIHDYTEGWKDGSIYGGLAPHARTALHTLMGTYAVFVHTSRTPHQTAAWLTDHGFTVTTDHDGPFWNKANVLLVTSHKYPALAYIDDRAICFNGWDTALDELDLRLDVDPHPLVTHARREVELCGQSTEDPAYARTLVDTVRAFTSYGHSGGSTDVAIDQLTQLLNNENLAPLTRDPEEWEDRSEQTGRPLWQNKRNSKVFSEDGGRTWWATATPNLYRERAHLVAHLAALHPSALAYSDPQAPDWPVVTITTPTGQMSWHINEADLDLFKHIPVVHPARPEVAWDGHTTEEKYDRLRALTTSHTNDTPRKPAAPLANEARA
ncbi:WDGH domain-containing protein [Nocardiopsis terrae]|uniref:WDGH domain-containing protein n=1 Tax=Streptomyces sp. NPDC057554 TaxID=3350538 RepID=UPI0036B902A7